MTAISISCRCTRFTAEFFRGNNGADIFKLISMQEFWPIRGHLFMTSTQRGGLCSGGRGRVKPHVYVHTENLN